MTKAEYTLTELGFSPHFMSQLDLDELEQLTPVRIVEIQRDRLLGLRENGHCEPILPSWASIADFAIGDWVLSDKNNRFIQILTRLTALTTRSP